MQISYSLLTHNETDSLYKLIDFLVKHKDEEDEIVNQYWKQIQLLIYIGCQELTQ